MGLSKVDLITSALNSFEQVLILAGIAFVAIILYASSEKIGFLHGKNSLSGKETTKLRRLEFRRSFAVVMTVSLLVLDGLVNFGSATAVTFEDKIAVGAGALTALILFLLLSWLEHLGEKSIKPHTSEPNIPYRGEIIETGKDEPEDDIGIDHSEQKQLPPTENKTK